MSYFLSLPVGLDFTSGSGLPVGLDMKTPWARFRSTYNHGIIMGTQKHNYFSFFRIQNATNIKIKYYSISKFLIVHKNINGMRYSRKGYPKIKQECEVGTTGRVNKNVFD